MKVSNAAIQLVSGSMLAFNLACTASHGDVFTSRDDASAPSTTCPDAIFCSDFETTPRGLSSAATGSAEVVSSPTHGGAHAFKSAVENADDWARLDVPLAGLDQVGLRVWLQLDDAALDLLSTDRYVLMALHAAAELNDGGLNKVSIDLESAFQLVLVDTVEPPRKVRSGFQLSRGQWHCLRLTLAGDQAELELDGAIVAASEGVLPEGGFTSLFLGVEYSLGATPVTVYYDDLVVGETAASCE